MTHGPESFRDYLMRCASEAGLGPDDLRPLPDGPAAEVAAAIAGRFGDAVRLLWLPAGPPCGLPVASRHFEDDRGWDRVARLAPDPEAPVWLAAENWRGATPRCYVFESRPAAIRRVLGEAHGFEYLVASRRLDWLLAEDHHSVMTAVGAPVVERLLRPDDEQDVGGGAAGRHNGASSRL